MIIRLLYTTVNQDYPSTSKSLSLANDLFESKVEKKVNTGYPLDPDLVKQEQQK